MIVIIFWNMLYLRTFESYCLTNEIGRFLLLSLDAGLMPQNLLIVYTFAKEVRSYRHECRTAFV